MFDLERLGQGREWVIPEGYTEFEAVGLWLGEGDIPLEIRVVSADTKPAMDRVGSLWRKVHNRRPAPMLLLATYPENDQTQVVVCGPTGDNPKVQWGLDPRYILQLCRTALQKPDRHTAARWLEQGLTEENREHPGIHNKGLLARHILNQHLNNTQHQQFWQTLSQSIRNQHGKELIEGLGYQIQPLDNQHHILKARGQKTAIAVLLNRDQPFDRPHPRFGNQTPIASALNQAEQEKLHYVLAISNQTIRLYPTPTKRSTARQTHHNTYLEANLPLLPPDNLWQANLLFGPLTLNPQQNQQTSINTLLEESQRFSHQLGTRLRERIYEKVVPKLANLTATQTRQTTRPKDNRQLTREELDQLYQTALTILYRLLFIAYAEDQDLLPYENNQTYQTHSLKTIAHQLAHQANQTKGKGMEDGTAFQENTHDLWEDIQNLTQAINQGNKEWGIPPYNGSMFSTNPQINPAGHQIQQMKNNNQQIGPILYHLLIDQLDQNGTYGPVDFRQLQAREFGTIYEGLLESEMVQAETNLTINKQRHHQPAGPETPEQEIVRHKGEIFLLHQSGVRKSTGTYFTPKFAVDHLLQHSLEPALNQHLQKIKKILEKGQENTAAQQLLQFRVADIAMGSGHFLIAAIDTIQQRFTEFLQKHPIPAVIARIQELRNIANQNLAELHLENSYEIDDTTLLRRLIARHSIYGIDLNPFAVDLAKLAVWTHTFIPGLPLSYLNHNLIHGNSLIGIGTLDEATDHDLNKMGITGLTRYTMEQWIQQTQLHLQKLAQLNDTTPQQIQHARTAHQQAQQAIEPLRKLLNILVAHRVLDNLSPIHHIDDQTIAEYPDMYRVDKLDQQHNIIHLPIAFPEIFTNQNPGFHCIISNPPWEKIKIEEHAYWATYYPGIRGLTNTEMKRKIAQYRQERPDLVKQLEEKIQNAKLQRKLIKQAPYHPPGSGDTDTYKAFAWRYLQTIQKNSGKLGVVLPGGSIVGKGSTEWRQTILSQGRFDNITRLLNSNGWVFPSIGSYTIALVTAGNERERERERESNPEFSISGPHTSLADWETKQSVVITQDQLQLWSRDLVIPMLPTPQHKTIYEKQNQHPKFDSPEHPWQAFRPTELHASGDREQLQDEPNESSWPVYKGASFDIWNPDTRQYYLWADPEHIKEHLYKKRQRQSQTSTSPFKIAHPTGPNTKQGTSQQWINNPNTLCCLKPRIALREVTSYTATRTIICALVPSERVMIHKSPYLFFREGDKRDEAYLLGVLSSMVLDWHVRRIVDLTLSYAILKDLPIPNPDRDCPLRRRIEIIAGRLATMETGHPGFKEWAQAVGVEEGSVQTEEEKEELIAELDALVAVLYGLDAQELKFIYDTFHHNTDYTQRYQRALPYHQQHTHTNQTPKP